MVTLVSTEFMDMIETIAGWAIAFLVVYGVVYAIGIRKDTLKDTCMQLDILCKKLVELAGKVNGNINDPTNKTSNEELIKSFRQASKKVVSLMKQLDVYLYDHGENTEVSAAIADLVKGNVAIRSAAISFAEEQLSLTSDRLLSAETKLQSAIKMLDKTVKKIESEKLVRI